MRVSGEEVSLAASSRPAGLFSGNLSLSSLSFSPVGTLTKEKDKEERERWVFSGKVSFSFPFPPSSVSVSIRG
jgi:hypothetical protein